MRADSLVITTGEPAGIGPEISVKVAHKLKEPLTLVGDERFLKRVAISLGLAEKFPDNISISHVPLNCEVTPGRLDKRNSTYVIETLTRAHELVMAQKACGIVTAPVQKSIIADAGFDFMGHTEFFQKLCNVKRVVMMLVSSSKPEALKVALATTHLPIKEVSASITSELLDEVFAILKHDIKNRYKIAHPRIAVTGLNPHAGENGYLGVEEIETISPAIARAQENGYTIFGPLPADTSFTPDAMAKYDVILCMYHDQGLPVLKHIGFADGVNVTLGLPYVRTSVDHGTALDIAGKGIAQYQSLISAIKLAHYLI